MPSPRRRPRPWSPRRAEANAVYEAQQAEAARAAADFETTLAARRDAAESEFAGQFETAKAQLVEAQAHLDRTRGDAQRIRGEAETGARRLLEDAQKEAEVQVAQARTHADRIREESDRELAAATQRRDSINARLGNVRQMLATLTGGASAALLGGPGRPVEDDAVPVDGGGDESDVEPGEEPVDEVVETADVEVDEEPEEEGIDESQD